MQTNQLKIPAMELIFSTKLQAEGLQLYQKYSLLQVFSKGFAQIFSYLKKISRHFTNFYFPEKLLVDADYNLRKPKMLGVSNGNLIVPKWQNIHDISNIKYIVKYSKTWPSSLLYIQQRRIQNPIKRLSKEVASLEVTILTKSSILQGSEYTTVQ